MNNIDIFGKRFNGYSLQQYINNHPETNLSAGFIVNHKMSNDPNVTKLFKNENLELFDWEIERIEEKLGIKNQISLSEDALTEHPLYKKANILHFHMYHNSHFPIEFLSRIPAEKKIIIEIHDTFWLTDNKIPMLEVFKYADKKNKPSLDAQRKRVLNSIDADFVVHSPFILNLFKQSSITKNLRVHLIRFGINSEIFKPLPASRNLRAKYDVPNNHLVLMCRSQKEFKGVQFIIHAIKSLKITQPITLITIGAKDLFTDLNDYCNILNFNNINDEHKMAELYNLADIFLAPSTEESFGFMAAEAMSCGTPVIVFEGTALPDTVHAPNIGIATHRSTSALCCAIANLANDPGERNVRGKKSRKFVLNNYSESSYFDQYIKLMKNLSALKARKTKKPPVSPAPKNLLNLQDFLNLKKVDFFDYNNTQVQNSIKEYNTNLYNNHLKQSTKQALKSFAKRIIPKKIKTILKNFKEK